jgi:HEPN domain-containing protein
MLSHKAWLRKAASDLYLAKKGVRGDDLTLDPAIYHTQQCAEKALKGFLVSHGKTVVKTHDLLQLLEACCAIDKTFETLKIDAATLTPFATEFRYPIDDDEDRLLERPVVLDAIERAEKILKFVSELLHDDQTTNDHNDYNDIKRP